MGTIKSFTLVWVVVIIFLSTSAKAATLIVNPEGQLTGAMNVDVGGGLFNVSFVEGTCIALFDGCDEISDFTFGDGGIGSIAAAAGLALANQVLVDSEEGLFDSKPDLTFGCSAFFQCSVFIPFLANGVSVAIIHVFNDSDFFSNEKDTIFQDILPADFNTLDSNNAELAVYAKFTAVTAVPLPPAALLFGTALVGLAGLRRRQRQTGRH